MKITSLKFKNGNLWNPEDLENFERVNDRTYTLTTEFYKSTYTFDSEFKTCVITNTNFDTGTTMKPFKVIVDFITFE